MILDCKDVFLESFDIDGLYEFGAGSAWDEWGLNLGL
jgi:hypothetical protein